VFEKSGAAALILAAASGVFASSSERGRDTSTLRPARGDETRESASNHARPVTKNDFDMFEFSISRGCKFARSFTC